MEALMAETSQRPDTKILLEQLIEECAAKAKSSREHIDKCRQELQMHEEEAGVTERQLRELQAIQQAISNVTISHTVPTQEPKRDLQHLRKPNERKRNWEPIFDALPDSFTFKDVEKASGNAPDYAIVQHIYGWVQKGMVVSLREGKMKDGGEWKKVKRAVARTNEAA